MSMYFHKWVHESPARNIPMALWLPSQEGGPYPLVMVGHGGSGHKTSNLVLDVVDQLMDHGIAVLAIDGPVHGDRRNDKQEGALVRQEFRDLWSAGGAIDEMVQDWKVALDEVCKNPAIDVSRIGWYGISMGTAYGIPVLAADSRIRAAVLGMWGTCRKPSERLEHDARKITIPVLFQVKTEDEIFTIEGQKNLYLLLGSMLKQYATYAGNHTDPKDEQLYELSSFLKGHLKG